MKIFDLAHYRKLYTIPITSNSVTHTALKFHFCRNLLFFYIYIYIYVASFLTFFFFFRGFGHARSLCSAPLARLPRTPRPGDTHFPRAAVVVVVVIRPNRKSIEISAARRTSFFVYFLFLFFIASPVVIYLLVVFSLYTPHTHTPRSLLSFCELLTSPIARNITPRCRIRDRCNRVVVDSAGREPNVLSPDFIFPLPRIWHVYTFERTCLIHCFYFDASRKSDLFQTSPLSIYSVFNSKTRFSNRRIDKIIAVLPAFRSSARSKTVCNAFTAPQGDPLLVSIEAQSRFRLQCRPILSQFVKFRRQL